MKLLQLVAPIYIVVFIGWALRQKKIYTDEVDRFISFITYRLMLPLSIFMKISTADIAITRQTMLYFALMYALMIGYFIIYQLTYKQKGFECLVNTVRGNSIYLGFPVMMQLLPAEILPLGMVIASAVSPLTIFGIEVLYRFNRYKAQSATMRKASFLRNPLVQGLLIGIVFNYFNLWHPFLDSMVTTITKPVMFLSLLIVGANFNTNSLKIKTIGKELIIILTNKIVVLPLLYVSMAYFLHFDVAYTVVGLILFATPGAVSNYVILSELQEGSDLTINATLVGTAIFLVLLPLLGYLVQMIV